MKRVMKVEIITDSIEVENVAKLLDEIGVYGYSIINDVVGKGSRGVRSDYELTGLFKNSYIMVVCNEVEMHKIAEAIRPIIRKFGGLCIVSDVVMSIGKK